jgi:transposase-like protein
MQNKKTTRQYRAPAEQRLQMVEQFHRSGLAQKAFSQQHGVPLATLKWWLKKTNRSSNPPVPVVFQEVKLAAPEALSASVWAMEVVAPSGLTIRCREELSVHDLIRLMRDGRC